jgi:hypothetical protein
MSVVCIGIILNGCVCRGASRTTPLPQGFTSSEELTTFSVKAGEDPPLGTTPDAVARTYARWATFGSVMETRLKDVGPYVSTPFVARDMLAMTKAAGFPKLKYWGVSYGSVLGACHRRRKTRADGQQE